jgi:hypothetical protein
MSNAYVHDIMSGAYFYHVTKRTSVDRPLVKSTIC